MAPHTLYKWAINMCPIANGKLQNLQDMTVFYSVGPCTPPSNN